MKAGWLFGCYLGFVAGTCSAIDAGIVTIADGGSRLLRGANWYNLIEGARIQDGDVIEALERGQVQVELLRGGSMNLGASSSLYVAGAGAREGRQPADLYLQQGWVKLATKPPGAPLRLRSPLAALEAPSAVVVARAAASSFDVFVETGDARVSEVGRSGADALRDVHAGDFVGRAAGQSLVVAGRAPQAFVAAMPRQFMDTLPARIEKFKTTRVDLKLDRPITFAEAEPWLNGPYRSVFVKRLTPRLSDAAFRAAASANAQAYPEWGSVLAPQEAAKSEPATKPQDKPQDKAQEKPGLPWPFGHR